MADVEENRGPSPNPKETEIELPELTIGDCDSKAEVRTKVWQYLEDNNLASFPRPVKNRIPNYKGSAAACDKVTELDAFRDADVIKINPDKPQEQARFRTLETNKTLLVPTPRLRKGLFNKIQPQDTKKSTLKFCSTSQGAKQYSSPLELDMKIKVDLVVIGSVAVSISGWRIGKGEGFADLEYGMMASVGAVNEDTLVVTAVHDCQVMDLPDDIFGRHDVTIDYICTPTRIIECSRRPKPTGIYWSLLSLEKFLQIPILKVLRDQEKAAGKDVTLEDASEDEVEDALAKLPEVEEEPPRDRDRDPRRRNRRNRVSGGGGRRNRDEDAVNGVDGGEHADGEDSPGAEKRRFNNRRKRVRNRRRGRDSERLNSEGEPMSPGPNESQGSDHERDGDGVPRKRRQRRFRQRPGDRKDQYDNDDREHSGDDQGHDDQGPRRPNPRRRNRQRRSEGDRNEVGEGHRDGEGGAPRRRPPRRYGYQNRRPRSSEGHPRSNEGRRYDNGEDHSDRDGGSPSGERRRRERPRRNNNLPTVYVGSLPKALRVSAFKKQVRDMDVNPLRVLWRGSNGHVFLIFETMDEAEAALVKLNNLSVNEKEVKVAMANRTERRRQMSENRVDDEGAGDGEQHVEGLVDGFNDLSLNKAAAKSISSSEAQDRSANAVDTEL